MAEAKTPKKKRFEFWIQMPVKLSKKWMSRRDICKKYSAKQEYALHMTIFHGWVDNPKFLFCLNRTDFKKHLKKMIKVLFKSGKPGGYELSEKQHLNRILFTANAQPMFDFLRKTLGKNNLQPGNFYTRNEMTKGKFHVSFGQFAKVSDAKKAVKNFSGLSSLNPSFDDFYGVEVKIGTARGSTNDICGSFKAKTSLRI